MPQSNYNSIGLCFEKAGKLDSAAIYFQKGIDFLNENQDQFPLKKNFIDMARGVIYGNLEGTFMKLNNFCEAEWNLIKSIEINQQAGFDNEDALTAKQKLTRLYIQEKMFDKASPLLNEIESYVYRIRKNNSSLATDRLALFKLKADYQEAKGNTVEAFKNSKIYFHLKDSIDKVDKGINIADIDEGFKSVEQQYRLEVLERKTQLKNMYLIASAIGGVLILTILGLVGYNLKRSRQNISELTNLNNKISEHNTQMQYALSSLEQSQRDNTKMMQVVAHDLRNPIGGMTMAASYMLKNESPPKKDIALLELILSSGNNSLVLINDILKINTGGIELNKESVDFYDILHDCTTLMLFEAKKKEQTIELDAIHQVVSVCREKMWRVMSNLIANAIKFSPNGGLISVKMIQEDQFIHISVEDFGIGVDEELQDKIFDMFSDAKREGTAGEKPFGMGLAISKQIIEAHNGKIWYENKKSSAGSIFHIQLPI